MTHALTIDVEEYFHVHAFSCVINPAYWDDFPTRVVESTQHVLDILGETDVKATFFVLGWVARRHPDLVLKIQSQGHEIGSHGYFHQRVDELTSREFRSDIRLAKQVLEDATGVEVRAYRAPSFSITAKTPWALPILVEEGHAIDSSLAAGRGARSGALEQSSGPYIIETSAGPITEFPLPAARVLGRLIPVGGGGYLRLFPYRLTRNKLKTLEESTQPFCVYLHPWELDPAQPRLSAPWRQNLRHRIGMTTTASKLRRLLEDFSFDTIAAVLAGVKTPNLASAA